MKRIAIKIGIAAIMIAQAIYANATTYNSIGSGSWSDPANWSGGNVPTLPLSNNDIVNISSGDSINLATPFVVNNNNLTINISGSSILILAAGLDAQNNLTVNVDAGGDLSVYGDFEAKNGVSVAINGTASIYGDLSLNANGTIEIDGSLTVDGDIITSGNNNQAIGSGTLIVTGAVDADFAVAPTVSTDTGSLPIDLVYFNARMENSNTIVFEWETRSELNNEIFIIEMSENGMAWIEFTSENGAGTSSEAIHYELSEMVKSNSTKLYFRLKQVDYNGDYAYSKIVSVSNTNKNIEIVAYPNPVTNYISVSSNIEVTQVKVLDFEGAVYSITMAENSEVQVQTENLTNGMYIAEITTANGVEAISFIKK